MARLQDFQTVTPTASDKLLVVQSQGQGLTTVGDFKSDKMDKANPTGTGALSINRKSGTTTGTYSATLGQNNEASGYISLASGQNTKALGSRSFAEGEGTEASGYTSHAAGVGTIANHKSQCVFGEFNVADTSTSETTARGNYVEIVGKGTANNARSNARTLDWNGNEVLAGGLKINGNKDVATIDDVETAPEDISSHFVLNSTDYSGITGRVSALYYPQLKRVQGSMYVSASAINTTKEFCNIDSGYRPAASASFPMLIKLSNNEMAGYYGTISSTGAILQYLTSSAKMVYFYFDYPLSR